MVSLEIKTVSTWIRIWLSLEDSFITFFSSHFALFKYLPSSNIAYNVASGVSTFKYLYLPSMTQIDHMLSIFEELVRSNRNLVTKSGIQVKNNKWFAIK